VLAILLPLAVIIIIVIVFIVYRRRKDQETEKGGDESPGGKNKEFQVESANNINSEEGCAITLKDSNGMPLKSQTKMVSSSELKEADGSKELIHSTRKGDYP
jgi:hypothetical protein